VKVLRWLAGLGLLICVVAMAIGSIINPNFWFTANQRGQRFERAGENQRAAHAYDDPIRQGVALYRDGDFKEAAAAFAKVGSAEGAFNQGNALLMRGAYDDCIKAYERALSVRPGWQDAIDNRNLAIARRKLIENMADDNTGGLDEPNEILVDKLPNNGRAKSIQLNAGEPVSDDEMRATWLRRVQTKPADFLRAKFAYQLQQTGGKP
jgi:Ca-activated chloride channel homolog